MNSFSKLFFSLQRAEIKFFRIGFKRKIFELSKRNGILKIVNSSRNSFFSVLFFGAYSLSLISSLQYFYKSDYISGILQIIIGIIGLRKLLWLLKGIEILTVNKTNLTVEKKGTFWTKKRNYELSEIKTIKSKYETKDFLSSKNEYIAKNHLLFKEVKRTFFYFTIGEIEFEYKGKDIKLFSNLTDNERNKTITELKKRIK